MDHYWWQVTLMPGEGWIVRRMHKRANLWPECEVEYRSLTAQERDQVLEEEVGWLLRCGNLPL